MNIGSILWPKDAQSAVNLYLGFLIKVTEASGISFPSSKPSPVEITKNYISGVMSEKEYRDSANLWWDYLDRNDAIREFQGGEVLKARLAICLLSVTPDDAGELGEHLSWFFEVLGQMEMDLDEAINMMATYFQSRE